MASIYKNFVLLDGTENMKPQTGMAFVVVSGKIIKVCKENEIDLKGINAFDLGGRYITPGLINMHVHIPGSGIPKKKETNNKKLAQLLIKNKALGFIGTLIGKKYVKDELLSGVTTIRAVGGVSNFDTRVRNLVNKGKVIGPRILASNMAIGVADGHMDGTVAEACSSVEEVEKMVEARKAQGVDLIKIMITGGVLDAKVKGEPGEMKMPVEYVKAACNKAHSLGLKVAAHVESPDGVKVAIENGVDTIEHGALFDDDIALLFKIKGASLVCTLSPALPLALFDKEVMNVSDLVQYNAQVVFNGIIDASKKALASGIKVGLGTDTGCPYCTHYNMWRELELFKRYVEVSPEFALYTATLRNAQILGIDDETGSIEEGKSADFVVLNKNPLEDFSAFANPYMVVMGGKEYSRPKVAKSKEVERRLNEFFEKQK